MYGLLKILITCLLYAQNAILYIGSEREKKMEEISTEAKFNAGVSISQEIDQYFKATAQCKVSDNFLYMYRYLDCAEVKMEKKFQDNNKAKLEIDEIRKEIEKYMPLYIRKLNKKKAIPTYIMFNLKMILDRYERKLMYYRDVFGYGMPSREDAGTAGYR